MAGVTPDKSSKTDIPTLRRPVRSAAPADAAQVAMP